MKRTTSAIAILVCTLFCVQTHADTPIIGIVDKPIWVSNGAIYIIIPADRKSVISFSAKTSESVHVKCEPPLPADVAPVVGGMTAFVQAGRTVYAIGEQSKRWGKLELPRENMIVVADPQCIRVSDNESFFIFGPASEFWIGLDMETGKSTRAITEE